LDIPSTEQRGWRWTSRRCNKGCYVLGEELWIDTAPREQVVETRCQVPQKMYVGQAKKWHRGNAGIGPRTRAVSKLGIDKEDYARKRRTDVIILKVDRKGGPLPRGTTRLDKGLAKNRLFCQRGETSKISTFTYPPEAKGEKDLWEGRDR